MRRFVTWAAGVAGVAALLRALRRRRRGGEADAEELDDPAAALRERLADQRAREDEAAPAGPASAEPGEALDERRAEVHARAQEAIESMRESEPPQGGGDEPAP